jgi:hypothetical protein
VPYRVTYSSNLELLKFASRNDNCVEYAVVPAVFQIRAGGRTRRIVLRDQCRNYREPTIRGKGWSANPSINGTWQDEFLLWLDRTASIPHQVIRVSVIEGGKRVASRTLLVRRRHTPGYKIWEGTDAFWNVCINGDPVIRSSGGRLYCAIPGDDFMSVKIAR